MSMSLFDTKPEGTGQPPFVDQAIQPTVLSVENVKNIIMQEQAGTVDPIAASIQILNSLGGNIAIPGDVLRQALTDSSLDINGPLSVLIAGAEDIKKNGSEVTVSNTGEIKTEISGTPIKFNRLVTFDVRTDGEFPAINNIQGVAVHKLFWFDIKQIQLRQDQGKRILHVETSGGARDFPLL
jgi:hypothetical protein